MSGSTISKVQKLRPMLRLKKKATSQATVTSHRHGFHFGGGDEARNAASHRGVPYVSAECVFSTGSSAGGMMTNVLVAAYPDVFVKMEARARRHDWDQATSGLRSTVSCLNLLVLPSCP